jgi:hypothetical protein
LRCETSASYQNSERISYPSKLIALDRILVTAPKPAIIHQLWQFLVDELLDLRDGALTAILALAGYVEIKRRVLPGQLKIPCNEAVSLQQQWPGF